MSQGSQGLLSDDNDPEGQIFIPSRKQKIHPHVIMNEI